MSYGEFDGNDFDDFDNGYGYDDFDNGYGYDDYDDFDNGYGYDDLYNGYGCDDYDDFDDGFLYDDLHDGCGYDESEDFEGQCNQLSNVHITPGLQLLNSKRKETRNTASVKLKEKSNKQAKEIIKKEKVKNDSFQLSLDPNLSGLSVWNFNCKNCFQGICKSTDIRLAENIYYIVINPKCFSSLMTVFTNPASCQIKCSKCSSTLGTQRTYKERLFPTLKIDSLRLELEGDASSSRLFKKWKDVPFQVPAITELELLNFTENNSLSYCKSLTAKKLEFKKEYTSNSGNSAVGEYTHEFKAVDITGQTEENVEEKTLENNLEYKINIITAKLHTNTRFTIKFDSFLPSLALTKFQETSEDGKSEEIKNYQNGRELQETVPNLDQQSLATLPPLTPPLWNFYCKKCRQNICKSTDIRVASNVHYVIINTECFSSMKIEILNQNSCQIKCNNCSSLLGHRQSYIGCLFPTIKIQAFSLVCENAASQLQKFKKWKDVPLQIPAISSAELLSFSHDHSLCN